ncbi:MAG: hypothetical protein IPG82_02060 [Saprospiraceae bacterium]|nr:hypothetical protein [Saprospiraceae bacterium]MBK6814251.1 hypothetical protein [Saprospiraceae bacterium]MBK7437365.1 hypothetical protein [Saprospiraceae bacterium]MBK9678498.1 hypothetical protein [Saprospiraceae bacterium]
MKKISKSLLAAIMVLIVVMPINAANYVESNPITIPLPPISIETKVVEARIAEIKSMDRSVLNSTEKRQLRNELRTYKKALNNGGVYLSVGSIIIIVLLLILLL